MISNPITVTYTSPNTTGSLSFTPNPNQTGMATITVTVMTDGGTANGGVDTTTTSFQVTVVGINNRPTLNAIPNPSAILENGTALPIPLSGISSGNPGSGQTVTVAAISSNPALIPNPAITYTNPSTTGTLTYLAVPNTSGTATITVTVTNSGGTANGGQNTFSQTFTVTVLPVNQQPTLSPITNPPAILEFPVQTPPVEVLPQPESILLSGISAGPGNTGDSVSVIATSSNPGLVTAVVTLPNPTGSTDAVAVTPVPGASGTATITVTVLDNGGTPIGGAVNGGVYAVSQTFIVTVTPVNQIPTINPIPNQTPILESTPTNPATLQTVNLSGITDGIGDVGQTLTVTAVSSNTALIPNPKVTYNSPNTNGYLTYTPANFASGTANITVTVMDSGNALNGGVNRSAASSR